MANNDKSLKLYRNTAPNGELHKDKWLEDELTLPVITVKDDTSITDPHFIIKTFDGLIEYNYLYYDDFKRYYYINDMILRTGGQVELICHVDVLYSFRNAIGELVVQEERATNGSSKFIYDDQVTTMVNKKISEVLEMKFDDDLAFGFSGDLLYTASAPGYMSHDGGNETPINNPVLPDVDTPIKYAKAMLDKQLVAQGLWKLIDAFNQSTSEHAPANTIHYSQADDLDDCNGTSKKPYGFTRFDTMYLEEKNLIPNLNFISDAYLANHYDDIPAPYHDNGHTWSSWDCAQFCWRCWYVGGGIDIASDTPGNGWNSYSTSQMIYLLNHGCYIPYTEIEPGDLIFSGYQDAIDNDEDDDDVHIACRSDAHPQWILKSEANAPSKTDAGYVEFRTTHVRMVYSMSSCVESVGNGDRLNNACIEQPTPQNPVQYSTDIDNAPYVSSYNEDTKLYERMYMCCRPSKLRSNS